MSWIEDVITRVHEGESVDEVLSHSLVGVVPTDWRRRKPAPPKAVKKEHQIGTSEPGNPPSGDVPNSSNAVEASAEELISSELRETVHHHSFLMKRGWVPQHEDGLATYYSLDPTHHGNKDPNHMMSVFQDGTWEHFNGQERAAHGDQLGGMRKYLFGQGLATKSPVSEPSVAQDSNET